MSNIMKFSIISGVFVLLFLVLYFLGPVVLPFFIAMILAYLCNPLVDKMVQYKIPRIIAVIIVFLFLITILSLLGLFLVPLLINQINLLVKKLPLVLAWFQNTMIPWLNQLLSKDLQVNMDNLQSALILGIKNNQEVIGRIISTITMSGYSILVGVFQTLLILVVTFYLLRDWHVLLRQVREILPRNIEPTIVQLATKYNEVLRSFLRGQLTVMFFLGLIYSLGLWVAGLQFAMLIGLISGLLSIIPYLGFSVGLITSLFAAYYQFGTWSSLLPVLGVYMIGQAVESMLLTPLLVGDRIGLHPVAVIFAVLTGGYLLGFLGALLALPIAAAIMVLLRFGIHKYYRSEFYV